MEKALSGKKVAILVEDGFEQSELTQPKQALEDAGAEAVIVSPLRAEVSGWDHVEWGDRFAVDVPLSDASPDDFDGLLLPGGVMNPDKLRMNPDAVAFVRAFADAGKPIAAIGHGPWTLIEADAVRGRAMTSHPSIRTDLRNAGAVVVDREAVVDRGLVTSRDPGDIPAFNEKMIVAFAKVVHLRRKAA